MYVSSALHMIADLEKTTDIRDLSSIVTQYCVIAF